MTNDWFHKILLNKLLFNKILFNKILFNNIQLIYKMPITNYSLTGVTLNSEVSSLFAGSL